MKKYLILSIALLAAACTEKYNPDYAEPFITPQGRSVFTAEVLPLSGTWTWDASLSRVGVYGSNVSNASFSPRAAFDGASGRAELMGRDVLGRAYAYLPYTVEGYDAVAEGCQPLSGEQRFFPGAAEQIEGNEILVAAADEEGLFRFVHRCGVLRLNVAITLGENVKTLTLSAAEPVAGWLEMGETPGMKNPLYSVTVRGIDAPCSEQAPLSVWVMLPEGTYTDLFITVAGETESISTIVEGTYEILSGKETVAGAKEQKNNYDGSDFESEEVVYD